MFKCQQIQDDYYLVADYRIKCFDGVWWGYAIVAAAGALLYTIGIPVGLYRLLRKNREHLYLDEMRKKNDDIQPGHGTPVDVDGGVDFTGSKQQRSNLFGWNVVHLLVARRGGEKTVRGVCHFNNW